MPGGQHHAAALDAEQCLVSAQQLQAVAVQAAFPRRTAGCPGTRVPPSCFYAFLGGRELQAFHAQLGLGRRHGGLDEGERVRRDGRLGARDVHDPQQRAGIGVLEWDRSAAPGVDRTFVVLGA